MKTMIKRTSALLIVLALCLSLLPATSFTAEAASYVYNWGTRGTVATYLSDQAEDFYADNNTSYAALSALSGSSSESGVPSSALFKRLNSLMKSNHSNITSYNGTRDLFKYTDCQNGGGKISSFYSGTSIGPSWDGTWNREHTWPNSKGDKAGDGENDLMMLRPTSSSENSSRGNKAYGQSSGYYNPNSESNNQYDLRGDVARIILYVYVRWECTNTGSGYNPNGIFGTDGVFESKQVLLDWMEADPVDTWELGRNDAAESILGTRNVFVDFPELSFILFGEEVPSNYTTPSGNGAGSSYTITAVSNNTSWGTVSVSGKTINATPKTGYAVSGYTVLNGTAEVTRADNAFTVNASSDVTIQINFAARSQNTVQFSQLGTIADSKTAYTGDAITLPSHKGTVETGYNFVGWSAQRLEETSTAPTFYAAGSQYTVNGDATLYALYSRLEGGSGDTSNVFEPYSGALTEGDYVIVDTGEDGSFAMVAASTGSNRLQIAEVSFTNGEVHAPAANIIWHIAPSGDYWTIYNTSTGKYAGGTGGANKATLLSTVTDFAKWSDKVVSGNTYEFTNKGNDDKDVNPLLRRNTTYGFACYAKNTNVGGPLKLYKRIAGTVYYFTNVADAECTHTNAYNVAEDGATCFEPGYTAGVYCPDCAEYISGHETINPINHANAYDVEEDGATCYEPGYTAGKYCPDCAEYISGHEEIPAGHDYSDGDTCSGCGLDKGRPGDVNYDGEIDSLDGMILLKYLNGWDVEVGSLDAMDVNCNGKIDSLDGLMLMRHLNGWEMGLEP